MATYLKQPAIKIIAKNDTLCTSFEFEFPRVLLINQHCNDDFKSLAKTVNPSTYRPPEKRKWAFQQVMHYVWVYDGMFRLWI